MEAVIAVSCSGAGAGPWNKTNSSSTRVAQALRPSAAVRVECRNHHEIMGPQMFGSLVIGGNDEWTHGRRRETRVRFAPKSNSMAEAQRRFDASHADVAAEVESRDVEKVDNSEAELQKEYKMTRVCDRLIEVFMIEKTTPAEWRKLLAFSAEWGNIRPYFFQRCSINAKAEEDPKRRGDLLKLARQLKEVDEDMLRHDELLGQIEEKGLELDSIVSKRRKDFTGDFFEHLHIVAAANFNNLARRDEIVRLAKTCLSAIEAYDAAQADGQALGEAQLKFDDILNSPSLEAAVNKIDRLAQRQQLDSTLMLLITKAYAAAKESTLMKEEVKDIMLHLYNVARGNMQRLVPKEIRIIRHLLSIQDPRERLTTLAEAFTPGNELEGTNEDLLFTTPDKLLVWIDIVLDAYRTNKQGTLMKEAQKLMNPDIISRVKQLRKVVEDQFM